MNRVLLRRGSASAWARFRLSNGCPCPTHSEPARSCPRSPRPPASALPLGRVLQLSLPRRFRVFVRFLEEKLCATDAERCHHDSLVLPQAHVVVPAGLAFAQLALRKTTHPCSQRCSLTVNGFAHPDLPHLVSVLQCLTPPISTLTGRTLTPPAPRQPLTLRPTTTLFVHSLLPLPSSCCLYVASEICVFHSPSLSFFLFRFLQLARSPTRTLSEQNLTHMPAPSS